MERKKDWLLAMGESSQKQGGSSLSNNPAQHYLVGEHQSQGAVMSVGCT